MAVARSNVLRQVSPDEQLNLERLADEVNRSYFGNSINIRPRWASPAPASPQSLRLRSIISLHRS